MALYRCGGISGGTLVEFCTMHANTTHNFSADVDDLFVIKAYDGWSTITVTGATDVSSDYATKMIDYDGNNTGALSAAYRIYKATATSVTIAVGAGNGADPVVHLTDVI